MSAPISLRRTGSAPLVLGEGWRLVASASSHRPEGFLADRWHEADLYLCAPSDGRKVVLTKARQLGLGSTMPTVLAVRYRSTWKGELGHEWAFEMPWADVAGFLEASGSGDGAFDPLEYVEGFPSGKTFEERQERLEAAIEAGWMHLVSDILEAAAAAS